MHTMMAMEARRDLMARGRGHYGMHRRSLVGLAKEEGPSRKREETDRASFSLVYISLGRQCSESGVYGVLVPPCHTFARVWICI